MSNYKIFKETVLIQTERELLQKRQNFGFQVTMVSKEADKDTHINKIIFCQKRMTQNRCLGVGVVQEPKGRTQEPWRTTLRE